MNVTFTPHDTGNRGASLNVRPTGRPTPPQSRCAVRETRPSTATCRLDPVTRSESHPRRSARVRLCQASRWRLAVVTPRSIYSAHAKHATRRIPRVFIGLST